MDGLFQPYCTLDVDYPQQQFEGLSNEKGANRYRGGSRVDIHCNHNAVDFAIVDADSNGHVTTEEAAAAAPEMTSDKFKAADANGNGVLSAEEYAVAIAQ